MDTTEYLTPGGVRVTRTVTQLDPDRQSLLFRNTLAAVESRRGGVLSSGMEYPGRYTRWHMAYVDPCMEFASQGRQLRARALNERGRVLLPVIVSALASVGPTVRTPDGAELTVPEASGLLTEEERTRRPTVFTALRAVTAALRGDDAYLGLYGAFGYDLAFQFEPIRMRHERPQDQRDLVLHLADELIVVDPERGTTARLSYDFTVDGLSTAGLPRTTEATPAPALAPVPASPVPGTYAAVVREAKERFRCGDLFEVVPGHVMYERCEAPAAFFDRLRKQNPAPYEFFFNLGDAEYLVGASPEMFVRVRGDRVETCPISGTIQRGAGPLEDAENIRTLLNSAKEESELTMCTDVDRNDKARVCVPGTVKVIGRRQIEMYSRLIHTVDHVEGRLRPGYDAFDAFLSHMWAVTVTGAPKTWAMQFIEEHEDTTRRWYGGAVGFVGFDGSLNTGLTIRTAQIRHGVAAVRAGATLLYDSDPEAEERETFLKARALLDALGDRHSTHPRPEPADGSGSGMRVLLVDHEDSFVHTLADYFRSAGAQVTTLRFGFPNELLDEMAPDLVALSPGPGRPKDFACADLLDAIYARQLPVFGVCLGLQAMVEHAGGMLDQLDPPVHGKPGRVRVTGGTLLADLAPQFTAARYHSLYAAVDQVHGFEVTAVLDDVVMAIEDPVRKRFAVQFHPESILTATAGAGHRIIDNVLRACRQAATAPPCQPQLGALLPGSSSLPGSTDVSRAEVASAGRLPA
ncbi:MULTISPECIES: anthranilate synthase component I [unclassified Streptomyces]|uniref:Anthranilate synthase n=1 Tax=Streptomyces sp. NBC_00060 TaxID=2975636 RepID=A0AAU2HC88_9ACTN